MFTIAFILAKLTGSLLLSWWWILLAFIGDAFLAEEYKSAKEKGYADGFEAGKEEAKEESEDSDNFED